MNNLKNAPIVKAQLVAYCFDISKPEQSKEYELLCDYLHSEGMKLFAGIGSNKRDNSKSGEVLLDMSCVFNNQYNTATDSPTNSDCRVFEWHESIIVNNRSIKSGHYIVPTPEILDLRKSILKCGYCGAHHWKKDGLIFCDQCLDSEYLDKEQLHLLRLQPVTKEKRKPLSDSEITELVPKYTAMQLYGDSERGKAKTAKQLADLKSKHEKAISKATTEYKGMLWLHKQGISLDNVIYYDHTGKFAFGWRNPVSAEVKSGLLDVLCEFPFEYEIESA